MQCQTEANPKSLRKQLQQIKHCFSNNQNLNIHYLNLTSPKRREYSVFIKQLKTGLRCKPLDKEHRRTHNLRNRRLGIQMMFNQDYKNKIVTFGI